MRTLISLVALSLAALSFSTRTLATEPANYDRIMFSVSAQTEVHQDKLLAILFAQEEGRDAARLADGVNQRIVLALDLAKNEPGIKTRTLGYSSYPYYKNQRVDGWVVSQSIEVQSDNPTQLGLLIGKLQSDLHVQSINYSVPPEVLTKITETLTEEALTNFRTRAERISKAWGRQGYRLVQMAIQDQAPPAQPLTYAMNRSVNFGATPPSLEPGSQVVSVTLTGTIELTPAKTAATETAGASSSQVDKP